MQRYSNFVENTKKGNNLMRFNGFNLINNYSSHHTGFRISEMGGVGALVL